MDDLFGGDEPDWFQKDDDGEGEDGGGSGENEEGATLGATTHVLILLECHDDFFAPIIPDPESPDDKINATTVTLRAVHDYCRRKIRTATIQKVGKRDAVGVLLYGTRPRLPIVSNKDKEETTVTAAAEEVKDENEDDDDDELYSMLSPSAGTSSSNTMTTVHELLPLEPPGVATVQTLQTVLPDVFGDCAVDLQAEYGKTTTSSTKAEESTAMEEDNDFYGSSNANGSASTSTLPPLLEALTRAVTVFDTSPFVKVKKTSSSTSPPDLRQVWIVTARDSPHAEMNANEDIQQEGTRLLLEKCKDMVESGIELCVWPVLDVLKLSSEHPFDPTVFYESINAQVPLLGSGNDDGQEDEGATTIVTTATDDWLYTLDSSSKKIRPAYRVPLLLPGWQNRKKCEDENGGTGTAASTNATSTSAATAATSAAASSLYPSPILLDFYNLLQTAKEPPLVPIHQETGKVLGKVRQVLTTDGSCTVLAEDRSYLSAQEKRLNASNSRNNATHRLRTFVEFGDSRVPLSLSDKVAIKQQSNANTEFASLIVLGFKPADSPSIPFYHAIEKSYFCYPNDSKNVSSVDAFAHLHQAMLRKNVVAIGELLTRVTATSRLVVMRALPEELSHNPNDNDDGAASPPTQLRPPGLLVTALPFSDEMRAIEADVAALEFDLSLSANKDESEMDSNNHPEPLVSRDLVQAAMDLVQKQTLVGVDIGHVFTNAAMSKFWNYIEHKALGGAEKVEDAYDTEWNVELIRGRSGTQIDALAQLLPQDDPATSTAGTKRKVLVPDTSGIDWHQVYSDGTLAKCKLPELKMLLKSIGQPVSGTKPVLLERVEDYLKNSNNAPSSDTTSGVKTED